MAYLTGIFDSSEGSDRRTLAFSDADNAMVSAVAKAQKNTIVVMVNPGAVLTPWTDDVAAALTMFMPGLVTRNDALSTPISLPFRPRLCKLVHAQSRGCGLFLPTGDGQRDL